MEDRPEPLASLHTWMAVAPWRRWLVAGVLLVTGLGVFFAGWFGLAMLLGDNEDGAAMALNAAFVLLLSLVLLPALHYGFLRGFRSSAQGRDRLAFRFGAEDTAPVSAIKWPWSWRLRHAVLYVLGIATLLLVFLPHDNQAAFSAFIGRYSAGRASAGSLTMLVFAWLPLLTLMGVCMLLLRRQFRLRDAGLLDVVGKRLLSAESHWLFSFAAAFAATAFLCRLIGSVAL
ncbi:TPA: hypothetical protein RNT04_003462 [Stenotrophomonas maltophilia]|nr:hypothetical protein [Stenotrophomonas maltophilia]HDS1831216.1 hypothetical protein [Stenotrophomonas maltophilia]HDX0788112.1 hypothetical protein [Stenotrophomonas maltophilia]HDX0806029.1 hypothetical protein [Stenotrophomonas maltophilia]HDX0819687.1 hypothetical protein [Stenotrophomonas maltophilia]